MGCNPNSWDVISVDTDAPDPSLTLSANGLHRTQTQRISFKHILYIKFNANIDTMLKIRKRGVNGPEKRKKKNTKPHFLQLNGENN